MATAVKKFPPQIKFIVGNEAAERFSFYGMRSILVIFMVNYLHMAESHATARYHLFVSACYLLPLLGAYLSDRYWGKYKTIMYLSLFYCVGHGVLSAWETDIGMLVGMGFIALGAGGIKPCVSAHVGDQFTASNKDLVQKVFDLFYWMINFGSFTATLLIPWVLNHYGSQWAFGIPGVLMAIATFIFWLGRKQYVIVPPSRESGSILPIPNKTEERDAVKQIAKVFVTISIFWSLYDQHASSWVLQGTRMNLKLGNWEMNPAQFQALNPILILLLIPVFSKGIYPWLTKKGFKVTPLNKMTVGMFLAAASFFVVALFEQLLNSGVQISIFWQVVPYIILTASEILISITGLEFAYTQSPRAVKSTIMSFWFLTFFAGNLLTAFISEINVFKGTQFYLFFALLMLAVSFVFQYTAKRYKVREYMEETN